VTAARAITAPQPTAPPRPGVARETAVSAPRPEPREAGPVVTVPAGVDRRTTVPYSSSAERKPEPSSAEPEAHFQAALDASTRAEASLSSLFKAIQEATTGVSGAREANDQLSTELQRVREMLGSSNGRRLVLERRLALVEEERDRYLVELEELKTSSARERTFLIEEQDRFLNSMIDEHEAALATAIRERDEARDKAARVADGALGIGQRQDKKTAPAMPAVSQSPPLNQQALAEARRTIEKLMSERDRARDVLRRLQGQRDEAQESVERLTQEVASVRTELERVSQPGVVLKAEGSGDRVNQDAKRTDPVGMFMERPALERPTFPAPQPDFDDALAASRAKTPPRPPSPAVLAASQPGTVRTPPPEELRAALFSSEPPARATPRGLSPTSAPPQPYPPASPVPPAPTPAQSATTAPPAANPPPVRPSLSPQSPKRPVLKQKPDPASHSLGGYSKSAEEIEPERIDAVRLPSSKPPRR
jgi:hypothetical protein